MWVNYGRCLKLCIGPLFETSPLQDKSCNIFTVFIITLKDTIVKLDSRDMYVYECKISGNFPTYGVQLR